MKRDPSLEPPFMLSEGVEDGAIAIVLAALALFVLLLSGFLLALACGSEVAWSMVTSIRMFYDGAPK